jgi:hypothetical protein
MMKKVKRKEKRNGEWGCECNGAGGKRDHLPPLLPRS